MPGKKSLRKVEKQQEGREKSEKKEKKAEKTVGSVETPDLNDKEFLAQLMRMKAITPTEVAIQFNLKVSAAKRMLEELRRNDVIDLVSQSQNLKVYALHAS